MKKVCLWLLLFPSLLPMSAQAQQTPFALPPSLPRALQAMPATSVAEGNVVLTVLSPALLRPAAAPPRGEAPLEPALPEAPVATPESITEEFGRTGHWFGHVYALAPPTMTVLNTSPALADLPLSTLASQHPTPFFIGSLTADQLRQMGTTGLAAADLSPDQQTLLKFLLPHPLQIVPKTATEPVWTMADTNKTGEEREEINRKMQALSEEYTRQSKTVSEETLGTSLRLYGFLTSEFVFNSPAGSGISLAPSEHGFETTGAFKLTHGGRADNIFAEGGPQNPIVALMRADTPNTPKDGDLEWSRPNLGKSVSLAGLKTVKELVARLAQATKLELYADVRYEDQPILLRGDLQKPQATGEVMQALALCVCGTWRQVGPAYLLTDDVQGVGARQEFLREMVQTWSGRLTKAAEEVGGSLRDHDWLHTLSFAPNDPGALPQAQIEAVHKERSENSGHLPWKDLPESVRTGLRHQLLSGPSEDNFAATAKAVAGALKPETSVEVTFKFQLAAALPETGIMAMGEPYRVQTQRDPPKPATTPEPPQAGTVSIDKPLRGVLCAPKTAEEAREVVSRLPKLGLNTLFLDVFTNGRTFFPNTSLPPASEKAASVLQAALEAAKPLHIPVYAVLDTLCWRKDGAQVHPQPWPMGFTEDLTVGGEAPDHAVQRELDAHSTRPDTDREYEMAEKGAEGWASPLDPKVRALLPALVRTLAATPGLAGLAFQDTATVGYRGLEYEYDDEGIALGYTPENRLAYLRAYHTDPVDLSSGFDNLQLFLPFEGFSMSFDISLSNFRSFGDGPQTWNTLRGEADKALLADCYAAAHAAAPALPLWMRERQSGVTFDPWTDPKKLNQYASLNTLDYPFRQITPRSILSITYGPIERTHPRRFSWMANNFPDENGKRAGGIVFDLVQGGLPDSLADTLNRLNVFLKKPTTP